MQEEYRVEKRNMEHMHVPFADMFKIYIVNSKGKPVYHANDEEFAQDLCDVLNFVRNNRLVAEDGK